MVGFASAEWLDERPAPVEVATAPDVVTNGAGTRPDQPPSVPESPTAPPGAPARGQWARVVAVVDGDTVRVRALTDGPVARGRDERVRLLEYDAPETGECWSGRATDALERLAPAGGRVWLVADRESRDRFGRHLRYLWTPDGRFVNREMVRDGFGEVVLFPPNDARIDEMRAAESAARRDAAGLWAACR